MMQGEDKGIQWEIEHDWTISKLLITNMNPKMFMYRAGQHDIYVQNVRPVKVSMPQGSSIQWTFDKPRFPHVAVVRSQGKQPILDFIAECPELEISRIFKSGYDFPEISDKYLRRMFLNVAKNMLALRAGSAFRIDSDDKILRGIAYECAEFINTEEQFNCKLDYNEYDYTLLCKSYKRDNGKWAVVTILYGWDMPNHWHML